MARSTGVRADRDFRRLWTADAVSQVGTQVGMLAVPLTAAVSLRATAWQMALLTTAQSAAFLLIGLPAGAWCDRVRKRPLLIVGDLGRAAVLGTIPLAWALGSLTMAHLFLVAALAGVLGVFFDVSYQSYLPALVGRERLVEGNASLEANRTVAMTAGPAVAGYLVQGIGGPVALLIDAVSFAWSGAWIASIRAREAAPVQTERRHLGREIREGLGFVFGHPVLRAIALYGSTGVFFGAAQRAVLLLFLLRSAHLSPGVIGVLFTCAGVGSIVGALSAIRVARRLGQARGIVLATVLDCGAGLLIPLAARGAGLGFYVAGAAVAAFAVSVFNIIQVSFRQALCPDHLLGRMNATMRFVLWGSAPLGALLGGALGTDFGLRTTMWITAIAQVLRFGWIAVSPLARGVDLSAATAGG
jgi:MFS family permease